MAARDDHGGDTQGKFSLGCASESLQSLTLLDCETVRMYARAVKQKVWNEAENRERNWGETLKIRLTQASHARMACEARALRARKTLTPRVTDFFTDFGKKRTVLQSKPCLRQKISLPILRQETLFYGPDSFSFCVQYKVIFRLISQSKI